jgi:hypothetical protein
MREVAIIGVGIHPWGKFPQKSFIDLGVDATAKALADANIGWKAIETICSGIYIWGGNAGHISGQYLAGVFGETGIPIVNVYNACATGASALRIAYLSIASGQVDVALAVGADMSPEGFLGAKSDNPRQDRDVLRWRMVGMPNPTYWALEARKRMERYGTTEEDLARVKVLLSQYGAQNPSARYKKVYRLEEVLGSKMVSDPLRLFEICATSDGAAALSFVPQPRHDNLLPRQYILQPRRWEVPFMETPPFAFLRSRLPLEPKRRFSVRVTLPRSRPTSLPASGRRRSIWSNCRTIVPGITSNTLRPVASAARERRRGCSGRGRRRLAARFRSARAEGSLPSEKQSECRPSGRSLRW